MKGNTRSAGKAIIGISHHFVSRINAGDRTVSIYKEYCVPVHKPGISCRDLKKNPLSHGRTFFSPSAIHRFPFQPILAGAGM